MRDLFKRLFGGLRDSGSETSGRPRLTLTDPPEMIFAMGDIHGCLAELQALEKRLSDAANNMPGTLLVTLGDYVDRGPDSAGVIDHLMGPPPRGLTRICLCGNHEQMLLDAYDSGGNIESWLAMGGLETLLSYGADHFSIRQAAGDPRRLQQIMQSHIPAEHIDFLRELPCIVLADKFAFVHAGVRPGLDLAGHSDEDFMWARTDYGHTPHNLGLYVVHGHTPTEAPLSDSQHINVDTGAYMSGRLTAVVIEKGSVARFESTGP